jgi:hypothetical protein
MNRAPTGFPENFVGEIPDRGLAHAEPANMTRTQKKVPFCIIALWIPANVMPE